MTTPPTHEPDSTPDRRDATGPPGPAQDRPAEGASEGTRWASGDDVRRQGGTGGPPWGHNAPSPAHGAWQAPRGDQQGPGASAPSDPTPPVGPDGSLGTPAGSGGYPAPGSPGSPPTWPAPSAGPTAGWRGDGPGAEPPGGRRTGRRIGPLLVVAVLAAALAAGGTLALQRGLSGAPATLDTAPRTVVQGNPAGPDWAATAEAVGASVVSIMVNTRTESGEGSGVIYDRNARVVTNNHVVGGAASGGITVILADQRVYAASVVGTDPATDLAVLKLDSAPNDLTPIAMGDDTKLKVGDPVMAVGNPLGLSGTVTTGIVSALNRPVSTGSASGPSSDQVVTNAIQTSAAINPGNSGGALVNGSGELVGINSAIASLGSSSSSAGNIGIGFAIPSNEVRNVADQLISTGKAQHAYLGVTPTRASTVVADGADRRLGAGIQSVQPGTAAADAGLRAGDAVVAVDGESVDSGLSLTAQIRERSVGAQVTLSVVRDGKRQDMRVTLGELPAP